MGRERQQPPRALLHADGRRAKAPAYRDGDVDALHRLRDAHPFPRRPERRMSDSRSPRYRRLLNPALLRSAAAAETDEEIESHIAMRAADLMRGGMAEADARAEAERRFGEVGAARRRLHEGARRRDAALRNRDRFGALVADVRFAIRQSRRAPTSALVVALTLAIGLGAATAMFSLVDHILLRPLPFPHADRLFALS